MLYLLIMFLTFMILGAIIELFVMMWKIDGNLWVNDYQNDHNLNVHNQNGRNDQNVHILIQNDQNGHIQNDHHSRCGDRIFPWEVIYLFGMCVLSVEEQHFSCQYYGKDVHKIWVVLMQQIKYNKMLFYFSNSVCIFVLNPYSLKIWLFKTKLTFKTNSKSSC